MDVCAFGTKWEVFGVGDILKWVAIDQGVNLNIQEHIKKKEQITIQAYI